MIKTATGEVQSVVAASVAADETDAQLQQSGSSQASVICLRVRLNEILEPSGSSSRSRGSSAGGDKVAVEQARASINQTTRERFKALSFDPWNGSALCLIGLGQIYLGRFDDALATFKQADRYDTPPASRWTWLLGVGMANVLMGRDEEALPWLQRSIAITPASGRSHLLLAAAYQRSAGSRRQRRRSRRD